MDVLGGAIFAAATFPLVYSPKKPPKLGAKGIVCGEFTRGH